MPQERSSSGLDLRLICAAGLTGIAAGLGGVALTALLHLVQHLAFGYTEATFLTGVERASPGRRVLALAVGGVIVGPLWWVVRRYTPTAPRPDTTGRTILPVAAEGSVQIIAVGFGASLGREAAPRELGAAVAGWIAARFRIDAGPRRTIVACGAGAGLASVYNVPLGGALFTLEVLLVSASVRDVVPALLSAAVATAVGAVGISDQPTYQVAPIGLHPSLLVFAVPIGPLAGLGGTAFSRLAAYARAHAPTGWRLPVAVLVVFTGLGAAATVFPQLLGNGKGPAQLALDGSLGLLTVAALLIGKPLATVACLGSGATGGLLTPAFATGALLGVLTGAAWSHLWPGAPISGFALVGAAAFLATTHRAPLFALVLALELTHAGLDIVAPLAIAVAGATLTAALMDRRRPADADPAAG